MDAELRFECEGGRGATAYRALRQDPPWKVVRGFPLPSGECLLHLNNVSGGIFGGDQLRLHGTIRSGAQVQVTTTGATRLYRPRMEAGDAVLSSEFHLEEGSLLEYVPDALIPYRDVRASQRNAFHLEAGATLFAWDVIAPGRVAHGERFCFERLKLITEVTVQGQPILLDRLLLEPARWPMHSPGRYGSAASYLMTFLAVQAGAEKTAMRSLENSLNEFLADSSDPAKGELWGASMLPAHGMMVRGTSCSLVHIPKLLHRLWSHCKRELLDRAVTSPRKTY